MSIRKPLATVLGEARVVPHLLKNKHKLATQVGNQRHEHENFNRVQNWSGTARRRVEGSGGWGNRRLPRPGSPAEGEPPLGLNWDLWLGPATYHP